MTRSGLVVFQEDLEKLLVPIDRVRQHPDNPNNGDVEAIAKSIEFNTYIVPVVVQRSTGYIAAGNHRYEALLALGSEVIPVIYADLDDATTKRFMLDDNHTAQLAQNDPAQLLKLLKELDEANLLEASSYEAHDIEQLQTIVDLQPTYEEFASWPTLSLTVPPHLKNAFYEYTNQGVSDHERLEILLRMAGWNGEEK